MPDVFNESEHDSLATILIPKRLLLYIAYQTVVSWKKCEVLSISDGLFYVSQFTVETYCFADGRCLFKQPQSVIFNWNQYDEEI